MMRTVLMVSLMLALLLATVQSAVMRFRRSPQEEGEAPALPWWCDPAQPGYAFYNNQAIKDWCAENAA